jgi:CMP-N-acetylneuraminic acid synthetase
MILGLIAARGGSKRIPNKNMRYFCGWPLIYRTMWQALKYPFDKVVLSTDDPEIKRYCAPALWAQMRPAKLATDTASKWDVFRYVSEINGLKPDDILVDLDTGCPFRALEDITACIDRVITEGYDVGCTVYAPERNPYFNMVEKNRWGDWDIVRRMLPAITRQQDAPVVYSVSPSVFAIQVAALSSYSHWSESRLGVVEIPRERAWDIDTEFDWKIAEMIMGSSK